MFACHREATAVLLAALAIGFAGCKAKADESSNLILIKPDDPVVAAAERKAAETLPVFWAKFDAKEPGVSHYMVKVALQAKDGGREILWAEPLRHSASEVEVRLANKPFYLAGLDLGSVIEVEPTDVVDWSYEKAGKLYGNFDTRVMMDRADPQKRAFMGRVLAPTPLEPAAR